MSIESFIQKANKRLKINAYISEEQPMLTIIAGVPATGKTKAMHEKFIKDNTIVYNGDDLRNLVKLNDDEFSIANSELLVDIINNKKNLIVEDPFIEGNINLISSYAKKQGYNIKLVHLIDNEQINPFLSCSRFCKKVNMKGTLRYVPKNEINIRSYDSFKEIKNLMNGNTNGYVVNEYELYNFKYSVENNEIKRELNFLSKNMSDFFNYHSLLQNHLTLNQSLFIEGLRKKIDLFFREADNKDIHIDKYRDYQQIKNEFDFVYTEKYRKNISNEINEKIDLSELIESLGGIKLKESTNKHPVYKLDGENFIITKNINKFFVRGEMIERNKSVIDFVKDRTEYFGIPKNEKDGINFINAIKILKDYHLKANIESVIEKDLTTEKRLYFNLDSIRTNKITNKSNEAMQYYEYRGFNREELLNNIRFNHLRMGNYFNNNENKILFPYYKSNAEIGGYEMVDKDVKRFTAGSEKSKMLFFSSLYEFENNKKIEKIIVFESPNNAIAFDELYKPSNTLYVATGGQVSLEQGKVLGEFVNNYAQFFDVSKLNYYNAFDNDEAGVKNGQRFFGTLNIDSEVIELKSRYKDFNDDLRAGVKMRQIKHSIGMDVDGFKV